MRAGVNCAAAVDASSCDKACADDVDDSDPAADHRAYDPRQSEDDPTPVNGQAGGDDAYSADDQCCRCIDYGRRPNVLMLLHRASLISLPCPTPLMPVEPRATVPASLPVPCKGMPARA